MNNIKKIILITLVIILMLTIANNVIAIDEILSVDELPFYYDKLEVKLNISGKINLTGNLNTITRLNAKLKHYPKDEGNTEIKYFNPYPDYEIVNNTLLYTFKNEQVQSQMNYHLHTQLSLTYDKPIIKVDPSFPLSSLPQEYNIYIQPTENIDIDKNIKNKATTLVEDSEGVFEATFNIASWVYKNIEYIDDEETGGVVQKSSWTLNNKKGVCDEKTSLFIAMTRSVGIPAKFVSGIAYSNVDKDFGNHAWAEVYFPNYGWVPFDVTYGEFGWLDSTHISLSESPDSKITSFECSVLGDNVQIQPSSLDFKTYVLEKGNYVLPNIDIDINILSQELGFGYNVIEAEITNNEEGYIVEEMILTKVQDLEVIGDNSNLVLLKPKTPKKINWVVKVNDTLSKKGYYKFPVEIKTRDNNSATSHFNVSSQGILYSESYINNFLDNFKTDNKNEYSSKIEINCELNKVYILNKQINLTCELNNLGQTKISDLEVCFMQECKTTELNANSKSLILFNPILNTIGLQVHKVTIENKDLKKSEYLNFNVKDQPLIKVKINNPEEVEFKDKFFIQTNITTESNSRPKKLNLSVVGSGMEKYWYFDSMDVDQTINLRIKGEQLYKGDNTFYININWENDIGEKFNEQQEATIKLVNLNLWQSFYVFINKIIAN
jgi:hypothetical protein